jgi:hypothetical protein
MSFEYPLDEEIKFIEFHDLLYPLTFFHSHSAKEYIKWKIYLKRKVNQRQSSANFENFLLENCHNISSSGNKNYASGHQLQNVPEVEIITFRDGIVRDSSPQTDDKFE